MVAGGGAPALQRARLRSRPGGCCGLRPALGAGAGAAKAGGESSRPSSWGSQGEARWARGTPKPGVGPSRAWGHVARAWSSRKQLAPRPRLRQPLWWLARRLPHTRLTVQGQAPASRAPAPRHAAPARPPSRPGTGPLPWGLPLPGGLGRGQPQGPARRPEVRVARPRCSCLAPENCCVPSGCPSPGGTCGGPAGPAAGACLGGICQRGAGSASGGGSRRNKGLQAPPLRRHSSGEAATH